MTAPKALWAVALCLVSACAPGPIVYVGHEPRDVDDDSDESAQKRDASDKQSDRDADADDDGPKACGSHADCARFKGDPWCDPARAVCVECLVDADCDSDEVCEDGDCEDAP